MKRGITAVIILILCILFSATANLKLRHNAEELYRIAQTATQDKSQLYRLEKEWNKQTVYFSLFIDHSNFEEISKKIDITKHLEGDNYRDACIEITADLSQMKKQLSYSFSNIF